MRKIDLDLVTKKIRELFISACEDIPENVLSSICAARESEESPLSREVLNNIITTAISGF